MVLVLAEDAYAGGILTNDTGNDPVAALHQLQRLDVLHDNPVGGLTLSFVWLSRYNRATPKETRRRDT
jgi:hypothetical protein